MGVRVRAGVGVEVRVGVRVGVRVAVRVRVRVRVTVRLVVGLGVGVSGPNPTLALTLTRTCLSSSALLWRRWAARHGRRCDAGLVRVLPLTG